MVRRSTGTMRPSSEPTSVSHSRLRSKSKKSSEASNTSPNKPPENVGTILAIAATLIVGVFAALGVSGNLLARMVRNDANMSRNVLLLAVGAAVLLAIFAAISKVPSWAYIVPVLILGSSLGLSAHLAATSQRMRENPSVSLNVSQPSSGSMTITAKATGSSLRSSERMLMRIAYITRSLSTSEFRNSTEPRDTTTELRERTNQECKRPALHPADPKTARLLSWTETGPNASGEASIEQTMPLPPHAIYVCAWVTLTERIDLPVISDDIAIIDLEAIRDP
jgi:hypothetical protein